MLALDFAVMRHLWTLGDKVVAGKFFAVAKDERTIVAANDLRHRRFLGTHRGGDEALHALWKVGHDGGDVRHVAVIVFEVNAAGADDAAREPQPSRLEHG